MYSEAYCMAVKGIDGCMIRVEADVSDGLPAFSLVGFLSSELKEARERVRIAMKNSGFRLPPKRITVNLSPADIRKDGTGYDLAIAVSVLTAFGFIPQDSIRKYAFIGELSLKERYKGSVVFFRRFIQRMKTESHIVLFLRTMQKRPVSYKIFRLLLSVI